MRSTRIRLAILAAVVTAALPLPAFAASNAFLTTRGLIGGGVGTVYSSSVISGDNVIMVARVNTPGSRAVLQRFNLVAASSTVFSSDPTYDLAEPAISGDWVVWYRNKDIQAKNIKTGVVKDITTDAAAPIDAFPSISGTFVVWSSLNGTHWDLKAKDLATGAAPFVFAGGAGNQVLPSAYGKRVAYLAGSIGAYDIYVKTIGSSAAAKRITNSSADKDTPRMGDHLVAWCEKNTSGKWMIRYYDFNTGLIYDGPSSMSDDMVNPRVSGDRIVYDSSSGANPNFYVWDTRIARVPGAFPNLLLAATSWGDSEGAISGNDVAWVTGGFDGSTAPLWGRLAAPSISVGSVPKRIARGRRLHLVGSISDQGHRIGNAQLGIERYSAGRWTRIKTLTASSTGSFSYYTPKNTSKTSYRVVYDGYTGYLASLVNHLSTVSRAKTAWPR
jgi:hypothetical protein